MPVLCQIPREGDREQKGSPWAGLPHLTPIHLPPFPALLGLPVRLNQWEARCRDWRVGGGTYLPTSWAASPRGGPTKALAKHLSSLQKLLPPLTQTGATLTGPALSRTSLSFKTLPSVYLFVLFPAPTLTGPPGCLLTSPAIYKVCSLNPLILVTVLFSLLFDYRYYYCYPSIL
jgi:hypothetical protein